MNHPDIGKLVLRVTLGVLMLFHGVAKLNSGVGWIAGMLAQYNLPGFIAYGVYVGEIIAPLMVIVGYYSRIGALVIAFNMVVALVLAHTGDFFKLGQHGAWALEVQAFFLFNAVAVFFLGAGKYSVKN